MKITITFPDGSKNAFDSGITPQAIARTISQRLAKEALAALVDGTPADLAAPLTKDCALQLLTFEDAEGKEVFWHSAEHITTAALKRLYPEIRLAMGPPIENGFYADFDSSQTFSEKDFEKTEQEIQNIIKEDLPFTRKELTIQEARSLFRDNPYKQEWLDEIEKEQGSQVRVTAYTTGDGFVDLCIGPHVPSTGMVKNIKLTRVAGAYWRGDAKNKMLQRIYGIAFPKKSELEL
ncbi:threonine--tRNA ligase, partial [Candidatus Woesearchaeota archaeon CG_4_10_14_0_8_um_filter_47_5]